jgi:cytochrome c
MHFDSFELSKIAGAVLCALLVIVGFRVALEIAHHGAAPEKPGYVLPMPEASAPGEGGAAKPAAPAFDAAAVAQAAATGNAEAGANVFKKCTACHSPEAGNKVGPGLQGIVGRPLASHAGFNYSEAMKAKGGDWTLEHLAEFIHSPKTSVPGTKMAFPGIPDSTDLADLLAYLNTLK